MRRVSCRQITEPTRECFGELVKGSSKHYFISIRLARQQRRQCDCHRWRDNTWGCTRSCALRRLSVAATYCVSCTALQRQRHCVAGSAQPDNIQNTPLQLAYWDRNRVVKVRVNHHNVKRRIPARWRCSIASIAGTTASARCSSTQNDSMQLIKKNKSLYSCEYRRKEPKALLEVARNVTKLLCRRPTCRGH